MCFKMNAYLIQYSQTVTHSSTNWTRDCLTSEIGRDRVLSIWYGDRQKIIIESWLMYCCRKLTIQLFFIKNSNFKHFVLKWMPISFSIPRRSPIQVLTKPEIAWLPRSDEIGYFQSGMEIGRKLYRILIDVLKS